MPKHALWFALGMSICIGCASEERAVGVQESPLAAEPAAQAAGAGAEAETAARRRPPNVVKIRRTSFGVPHIRADNERGLGFGAGYAYAEDNACLLADAILIATGQRSKFFGPDNVYDPMGILPPRVNLVSDFFYKLVNEPSRLQTSWDRQPSAVRQLLEGYAAGWNRYLRDTPRERRPEACRDAPWLRDITALDLIALMRRFTVEGSSAPFMDALYIATPPGPSARRGPSPVSPDKLREIESLASPGGYGSNAVALGRDGSVSGRGLLLANPHFPWASDLRFYQHHLTIPGRVDVMGSTFGGFPVVFIGWNQDVAWSHTVCTSRNFTMFGLQLDPNDPTKYLVDGRARAMTKKTLRVELPNGEATHDFYMTDFGPVIAQPEVFEWTRGMVFTLRDANLDNDQAMNQWWEINRANSAQNLKRAVDRVVGMPWVNVVAADRDGAVYYGNVTPVPNVPRDREARCLLEPYQPLVPQGLLVLNGSDSGCDWRNDPAAPRRGIFPASSLPSLTRRDFVQNSNDSAWMTNPARPLTGFPSIASVDGLPLSARTRYGLSFIHDKLTRATRTRDRFDVAALQKALLSNRSYTASHLLGDLRTACGSGGVVTLDDGSDVDIGVGCDVLAAWDGAAELTSIGAPLFEAWRIGMEASGVDFWTVPFDRRNPTITPRGLRVSDAAVRDTARKLVGQAMADLEALGVDYTRPWGELQVAVRGDERIPIHGGDIDDIYNSIYSVPIGDGQLDVVFGSSTIWTVSYEGASPKVQGFLTYSQSTDPASPHFADQTERFSSKAWITYPFTEAEIAADRDLRTRELRY